MPEVVRIGAGAGTSGDRIDPAVELAERGELHYLVFECLAERTIAIGQLARLRDSRRGYDPLLEARWRRVLPLCHQRGIKIITNMGAANPAAALEKTTEIARELGLKGLRLALLTGDDVTERIRDQELPLLDGGQSSELRERLVSANAYLGADGIVEALATGADVVITGRVADPSLFLAAMRHAHGWAADDWTRLGRGTSAAHLLECTAHVTGGFFAEPGLTGPGAGRKDVPNLARLGFPLAEVHPDGRAIITKVAGSGGLVSVDTCAEQLLYEVHDPAAYITPDVVADFSNVQLLQQGPDRVEVLDGAGRPRTDTLKVSLGYRDGYLGEGSIVLGGPGCLARGELAVEILRERLRMANLCVDDLRIELLGLNALYGPASPRPLAEPNEVMVRVAARGPSVHEVEKPGLEIESLCVNGPAGAAGHRTGLREVVAMAATLLPRDQVPYQLSYAEV
jgi:hypothetical protein